MVRERPGYPGWTVAGGTALTAVGVLFILGSAAPDWEDGATRLAVWFEAAGDDRSRLSMAHQRLPDADAAEGMRDWWRGRLDEMKRVLEAG